MKLGKYSQIGIGALNPVVVEWHDHVDREERQDRGTLLLTEGTQRRVRGPGIAAVVSGPTGSGSP